MISTIKGRLSPQHKISTACIFIILFTLVIPPSGRSETKTPSSLETSNEQTGPTVLQKQPQETRTQKEQSKESVTQPAQPGDADEGGQAPNYEYQEPEFTQKEVSYPLLILRTVAVLGVIIIGIYLIFRLLLKNKRSPVRDSEIVRILATYPLAANRLIQIVDIGGQILVIGVSESSVNLITEIEDKEVIDRIKLLSSKESRGTGGFKDQFLKLIGGKSFSKPGQISYLGGYKKRIDRMKKM